MGGAVSAFTSLTDYRSSTVSSSVKDKTEGNCPHKKAGDSSVPTVSTPDGIVHYDITRPSGDGGPSGSFPTGAAPLVLLHGTGGSGAETFGPHLARFAHRRTVITPDYAGSELTTDPGGDLTVELLVRQVVAAVHDALDQPTPSGTRDETPVDLLGFSLGAVVAAATAARHPDLVRRLILVAGWPASDDPRLRLGFDLWAELADRDLQLYLKFCVLALYSSDYLSGLGADGIADLVNPRLAQGISSGNRRQIELDRRVDIRDLLPRIKAPTLVIGCARDHLIPVSQQRRLHRSIPDSRYVEIDSGHLVLTERPDEFHALVEAFLADTGIPDPAGASAASRPDDEGITCDTDRRER